MENKEIEVKEVEVIEAKETVKQKIKKFYVKHKTKIAVGVTALTTAAVTAFVCSIGQNDEDPNEIEEVYFEAIEAPTEVIEVTTVEATSEEV